MSQNIIERMAEKTRIDEYFIDLFTQLEKSFFYKILYKKQNLYFTQKEFLDLLRFADILSLSINEENRNISIKIIGLLNEFYQNDPFYDYYAKGIMLRLGNFPSYNLISEKTTINWENEPFDIFLERTIKEEINKNPYSYSKEPKPFTDSQLEVFSKLLNKDCFSFSGPTSFGKSFILSSFISHIISTNNKVNIAFVVPTRALISQNIKVLKEIIKNKSNYLLFQNPDIPKCLKNRNFIFVFTPERLVEYLSNKNNPKISSVFVDEAQKILSEDSRSAIYYYALSIAKSKKCNLYFSSPNIPNTDVFLDVFEKPKEEKVLYIKESPVSQNRCFINIVDKKVTYFSFINESNEIEYNLPDNLEDLIKAISEENNKIRKSVIYCNTIELTINLALNFAKKCDYKNSMQIDKAVETITKHVHEDYFLIDCIKKGVAFHFGKLPQVIRTLIEDLYVKGEIDYLFCTSTLLEGVNLPAQNIFILNNKIGNTKLTSVDFWNLAGRAGRLAKDLYGNVFCIRYSDSNKFWKNKNDLNILKKKEIDEIKVPIVSGKSKFYENIKRALIGDRFTQKSPTANKIDLWNSFANILLLQNFENSETLLKTTFNMKVESSSEILSEIKDTISVPHEILSKSPLIKWKYQDSIFIDDDLPIMSTPSYDNCLEILELFYDKYNWKEEESHGRYPLINNKKDPTAVLKHYAYLMYEWMKGTTTNLLIKNQIKYYTDHHSKIEITYNKYETFDQTNKKHINKLINNTMEEIDNILRFKIKNYCENYVNILKEKDIDNVENRATYLEHGCKEQKYIEIQKLGIPRHLVDDFYKRARRYLIFDDNDNLIEVNFVKIKAKLEESNSETDRELLDVLNDYNLLIN